MLKHIAVFKENSINNLGKFFDSLEIFVKCLMMLRQAGVSYNKRIRKDMSSFTKNGSKVLNRNLPF